MRSVARLFLLLMVVLTVPVQGVLAVTVGQCRTLDHHGGKFGGHDVPGHETVEASSHQHDHPLDAALAQADSDESVPAASPCGPCSACCASPAISGPSQPQLVRKVAFFPDPQADLRRHSAGPSRLDRPPLAL